MKDTLEKILAGMRLHKDGDTSDWRVHDCGEDGRCYELEQWSAAGEDVIIVLRGATLAELAADAREAWENFDADEHAAQIYLAKREGDEDARRYYASAPDSLCDLLADARYIKDMHKWVWQQLDQWRGGMSRGVIVDLWNVDHVVAIWDGLQFTGRMEHFKTRAEATAYIKGLDDAKEIFEDKNKKARRQENEDR